MPPAGKPAEPSGPMDSRKTDQPGGVKPAILQPAIQGSQSAGHPLPQATADQGDGDTSQHGTSGEGAAPTTPLAGRGFTQPAQLPAAPAQQVADGIVASLAPSGGTDVQPAPPAVPRPGAVVHPVKVLTIQLHPAELGTVTVRMTLKGDAMDVEVEAGRRATAQAIEADREALTGLLRSAGYHVEVLTVRAVDPSSTASPPGALPGSADAGPQLQSGGAQPDARASGNRAQPESPSDTQLPDRDDHDNEQAAGHRRGAGLYV
jgi:chemotaxis protein MotD